nr:hypothetical protein [Tanacetum cinerariifolium]
VASDDFRDPLSVYYLTSTRLRTMDTTIDQQVAMDEALVPTAQ